MYSDVRWLIPHKVILLRIYGDATVAQLEQPLAKVLQLLQQQPTTPIHIVFDMRTMRLQIAQMNQLRHIAAPVCRAVNMGKLIFVTPDQQYTSLGVMLGAFFNIAFEIVSTWEQVMQVMRNLDVFPKPATDYKPSPPTPSTPTPVVSGRRDTDIA